MKFSEKKHSSSGEEKYADFDGFKLEIQSSEIQTVASSDDSALKGVVFVETTKKNLNKLVMSVISDDCIVVEGDLSTGKTMLVEYLAQKSNNELIKYQMDDFMDSKSLIGNFVCSDIPGEFLWKAGPLYQVMLLAEELFFFGLSLDALRIRTFFWRRLI